MKTYCDLSHFDRLSMPIGIVARVLKNSSLISFATTFRPQLRAELIFSAKNNPVFNAMI